MEWWGNRLMVENMKLSTKGNLMDNLVINKWLEIWETDLERKFSADFEVYGEKAKDQANAEVDILIALK
ncbi:hypothetical protein AP058_01612 [Flavobacterium sp. TAB 87]|nr:hypothetical protein AP058_01612 [Flavobacterium sp. TAB 87]